MVPIRIRKFTCWV